MSGNIANGRKGPSETCRYTYLHFGGMGIAFQGSRGANNLGLTEGKYYEKEQALRLDVPAATDSGASFFSSDSGDIQAPSLLTPSGIPRYWYSGPDAKEEELVVVTTRKTGYSGGLNLVEGPASDVYVNNTKTYSYGSPVLSAAVCTHPIYGRCLFMVASSFRITSPSSYTYMAIAPLRVITMQLSTKEIVCNRTLPLSECGLKLRGDSDYIEIPVNGTHNEKGDTFHLVVPHFSYHSTTAPKGYAARHLSITYDGAVTSEEALAGDRDVTIVTTASAKGSITPDHQDSYYHTVTGYGSFVSGATGSSRSSYRRNDAQVSTGTQSILWRKEYMHDGAQVDYTITRKVSQSTTSSEQSDSSSNTVSSNYITMYGDGYYNTDWGDTLEQVSSSSSNVVYEVNDSDVEELRLWDGVVVTLLKDTRTNNSSSSSGLSSTRKRTTVASKVYTANGTVLVTDQLDFHDSLDYSAFLNRNTHSSTYTRIHRTLLLLCSHSKTAVLHCYREIHTANTTAHRDHRDRHYTIDYSGPNEGAEFVSVPTGENSEGAQGYTTTSGHTYEDWFEVIQGASVTEHGRRMTLNESTSATVPPSNVMGSVQLTNFTDGLDINTSTITYGYLLAGQDRVCGGSLLSGSVYARNSHIVGLRGNYLVMLPKAMLSGDDNAASQELRTIPIPLPSGYLITINPAEAKDSKGLSFSLEACTFFKNVYPTV